ncbi:hypothetical protein RRG08_000866 [Elysia crispata]|uniref:Uncharacterized protein n=1 Tax=Elysia crispata TaxID=231223 RepID=A0AAE1DDY7_9GAST|nr:hypothetical protein RRG08_000866 [Elysia crispata]
MGVQRNLEDALRQIKKRHLSLRINSLPNESEFSRRGGLTPFVVMQVVSVQALFERLEYVVWAFQRHHQILTHTTELMRPGSK